MSELIGDSVRASGLRRLKQAVGLVTRLVPIPQPTLLVGPGSSARLGSAIAGHGHRKVFVVTDAAVAALGLARPLLAALRRGGAACVVFDEVTPDAPLPVVERGIERFEAAGCDAVAAVGGGSVLDAAKVIALAAANHRHPTRLVGYFRALHRPVPIYAVPTTAGTGSEVTVAALVSDPERHRKLLIADTRIVPVMAALDARLMTGLPAAVTAATGMDALTHAVEAFVSDWATPATDRLALAAVTMVWDNLPIVVRDGARLDAREQMALAANYAGLAFTRASVGNVHAIAHQLGGWYHTPHGLANAIMLPPVLRFSAPAAAGRLATLARRVGLERAGDSPARLAQRFVDAVEALNRAIGIPRRLDALREADLPAIAAAACREADFNYPVPRVMSQADCVSLLREVLPQRSAGRRGRAAGAGDGGSGKGAKGAKAAEAAEGAGGASRAKGAPARRSRVRGA